LFTLQVRKLNLGQKKAHLIEIQVNGGSVSDKVDFATKLFEKAVTVDSVFNVNEMIDTIAITKVGSICCYCLAAAAALAVCDIRGSSSSSSICLWMYWTPSPSPRWVVLSCGSDGSSSSR
jgi:hypothetical protein